MDKLVGRVYKIVCKTTNKQYVGSTIYPLKFRLQQHEKAFAGHIRDPTKSRYCASFDILKENNYEIELLELNEYETRNELLEHEKYYIQSLENIVNRYIPSRTKKQYYKDNIDHYKQKYQIAKNTDHYKKHIECRCGRHYTENSKHNHLKSQYHKKYILSILYINNSE
jgi:hypothetical protein